MKEENGYTMVEKEKLAAVGGCDEFEIFGAMMPGSPVPRIPLNHGLR